jgi:hypothetical protein
MTSVPEYQTKQLNNNNNNNIIMVGSTASGLEFSKNDHQHQHQHPTQQNNNMMMMSQNDDVLASQQNNTQNHLQSINNINKSTGSIISHMNSNLDASLMKNPQHGHIFASNSNAVTPAQQVVNAPFLGQSSEAIGH